MRYDYHLPDGIRVTRTYNDYSFPITAVVQEGVASPLEFSLNATELGDGSVLVFKGGRRLWLIGADHTVTSYDANEDVTRVGYPDGRIETLADGKVSQTTFADGSRSTGQVDGSTITLDASGIPIRIRQVDGQEAQKLEDATWRLAGTDGSVTSYRADGTPLLHTLANGVDTVAYETDGTRVVTTSGVQTFYRADGTTARRIEVDGGVTTYNSTGTPIDYVGPHGTRARVVTFADGQYAREYADGTEFVFTRDNVLQRTRSNTGQVSLYNAAGKKTAELDEATGEFTTFIYQADGGWSGRHVDGQVDRYNAAGILQGSTLTDGTTRAYPHDGVVTCVTTYPNGLVVTEGIDSSKTWQQPDGTVTTRDAAGVIATVDAQLNAVATTVETDGSVKIARPDGTWRFLRPDGTMETTAADATTLVSRLAPDGTSTVVNDLQKTVNHADGSWEVYTLDDTLLLEHHKNGTSTRHNADGSTVELSATGSITGLALVDGTAATFDAANGYWTATNSAGTVSRFRSNGTVYSETSTDGEITLYGIDGSYTTTGSDGVITFYDAAGTTTRVLDHGDDTSYSSAGLPVRTDHLDGSVTVFDTNGFPLQRSYSDRTDFYEDDGSTVTRNLAGALLSISLGDGTICVQQEDGTWVGTDTANNVHLYSATGVLTRLTSADGNYTLFLADGVQEIHESGRVIVQNPDGTSVETDTDNSITTTQADGTSVTVRTDHTQTTRRPDGTVEDLLADGTLVIQEPDTTSTENTTPTTTTVYKDGTRVREGADHTVVTTFLNGEIVTRDEHGHVFTQANEGAEKVALSAEGSLSIALTQGGPTLSWLSGGIMRTAWTDGRSRDLHTGGKIVTTGADETVTTTYRDGLTTVVRADTSHSVIQSDGTRLDVSSTGAVTLTISDGSTVVRTSLTDAPVFTAATGSTATMGEDGAVSMDTDSGTTTWKLDGSVVTVQGTSTVTLTPDGMNTTDYGDGSGNTDDGNGTYSNRTASGDVYTTLFNGDRIARLASQVEELTRLDGSYRRTLQDTTTLEQSADGHLLTVTLADGSTVSRSADGTLTAQPVTDSTLLAQDAHGAWVATLSSGDVITWAGDGTGVVTVTQHTGGTFAVLLGGALVITRPDGSSRTVFVNGAVAAVQADGTRTLRTAAGYLIQERANADVVVQRLSGTTRLSADGTTVTKAENGDLIRTRLTSSGGFDSTRTWHPDASSEVYSSDGSTVITYADGRTEYLGLNGEHLSVDANGSMQTGNGSNAEWDFSDVTDPWTLSDRPTGPVTVPLADGKSLTIESDGKVTITFQNGEYVSRTPDGTLTQYFGSTTTTWYANGSVEQKTGDVTKTWIWSSGTIRTTSPGNMLIEEANGTVTTVSNGHTTVRLPSGVVFQDGTTSSILYMNDDTGTSSPSLARIDGTYGDSTKGSLVYVTDNGVLYGHSFVHIEHRQSNYWSAELLDGAKVPPGWVAVLPPPPAKYEVSWVEEYMPSDDEEGGFVTRTLEVDDPEMFRVTLSDPEASAYFFEIGDRKYASAVLPQVRPRFVEDPPKPRDLDMKSEWMLEFPMQYEAYALQVASAPLLDDPYAVGAGSNAVTSPAGGPSPAPHGASFGIDIPSFDGARVEVARWFVGLIVKKWSSHPFDEDIVSFIVSHTLILSDGGHALNELPNMVALAQASGHGERIAYLYDAMWTMKYLMRSPGRLNMWTVLNSAFIGGHIERNVKYNNDYVKAHFRKLDRREVNNGLQIVLCLEKEDDDNYFTSPDILGASEPVSGLITISSTAPERTYFHELTHTVDYGRERLNPYGIPLPNSESISSDRRTQIGRIITGNLAYDRNIWTHPKATNGDSGHQGPNGDGSYAYHFFRAMIKLNSPLPIATNIARLTKCLGELWYSRTLSIDFVPYYCVNGTISMKDLRREYSSFTNAEKANWVHPLTSPTEWIAAAMTRLYYPEPEQSISRTLSDIQHLRAVEAGWVLA